MEQEKDPITKTQEITTELIRRMGYYDASVQYIEEKQRLAIFINDRMGRPINVRDELRSALEHIVRQVAHSQGQYSIFVDINNYRANRERLIVKLAKAAARKAVQTSAPVELPPMNSYERRLVHMEIAMRPDVETESRGEGKGRHVVVRPI